LAKFRESGFAKVRRGITEHLRDGKIGPNEFTVYMLILLNADPSTGVWHGSAGLLAAWYSMSPRTCRDNLEKLEQKEYIKRFPVRGKHASYPILIHRFECSTGAVSGKRLNAIKSLSCDELVYDLCDDGAGESAGAGAGKYLEKKRSREKNKDLARDKREPDARHMIFRDALERYWRHTNASTTLPELPWDGREAKALDDLLSASPTLDAGAFLKMLNHRRLSEVNQVERCYVWLRKITDYAGGPLDRFGKPLGEKHATSGINRAQARTDANRAAAQAALERISLADGDADVAGFGT